MKTKFTMLLAFFITIVGFAQDDWQTHAKDNYSIQYPENWEYSEQKPQPTIKFVLMAEEASQKEDLFRENINLNTENLGEREFTLDSYIELSLSQISKQVPTAEVLSRKDITLNDIEAKEVIWSADFGNSMVLKFKQYILLDSGSAYILTYTSTAAEYEKYLDQATGILNSFKIKS